MTNTRHLKRHSAPKSWPIKRKGINFISRPQLGGQKREYSCSVLVLLRDLLHYVETAKEAKFLVHTKAIVVNGKEVKDIKHSCALFDILELKTSSEKFRLLFDTKARLKLVATKDASLYLKVSSKTVLSSKKYQMNCSNGMNILVDEKTFKATKVEDTLIYDYTKSKITGHLPLKEKSFVYLFDGKFKGNFAQVESFVQYNGLSKDIAHVKIGSEEKTTAKAYCFVLSQKKEDLKSFE